MTRETVVYFASVPDGGPIKIGCSQSPLVRLSYFLSLVPFPLEIIASAPGRARDERKIHGVFVESHIRSEWFRPSVELWALIGEIRRTGRLPDSMRGDKDQPNALASKNNPRSVRASPEWRNKISEIHKARWAKEKAETAFDAQFKAFMHERGLTPDEVNSHFPDLRFKPVGVRPDGSMYFGWRERLEGFMHTAAAAREIAA